MINLKRVLLLSWIGTIMTVALTIAIVR